MRRPEVEALVDDVLRGKLARAGFHHAVVTARPDESGDQSLYIDVFFDPQLESVAELPVLDITADLRKRLLDEDEERFPYVRYVFDDGVVDGERETATP